MAFFFLSVLLLRKVGATLMEVADHIDHIRKVCGGSCDHIGIGADYDGIVDVARGLEDVSTVRRQRPPPRAERPKATERERVRERGCSAEQPTNSLWSTYMFVVFFLFQELEPEQSIGPTYGLSLLPNLGPSITPPPPPPRARPLPQVPYLTAELLERGYGEDDIAKILGGNALRVLAKCEEVEFLATPWHISSSCLCPTNTHLLAVCYGGTSFLYRLYCSMCALSGCSRTAGRWGPRL